MLTLDLGWKNKRPVFQAPCIHTLFDPYSKNIFLSKSNSTFPFFHALLDSSSKTLNLDLAQDDLLFDFNSDAIDQEINSILYSRDEENVTVTLRDGYDYTSLTLEDMDLLWQDLHKLSSIAPLETLSDLLPRLMDKVNPSTHTHTSTLQKQWLWHALIFLIAQYETYFASLDLFLSTILCGWIRNGNCLYYDIHLRISRGNLPDPWPRQFEKWIEMDLFLLHQTHRDRNGDDFEFCKLQDFECYNALKSIFDLVNKYYRMTGVSQNVISLFPTTYILNSVIDPSVILCPFPQTKRIPCNYQPLLSFKLHETAST